jgi:uncharacterized protein (DUF2236 family)
VPPGPRNPVARKINAERIVILGWGRAILLQLAHPLVAHGVADHSRFGPRPVPYLKRAWRTVGSMLSMTFGTEAEAKLTANHINAIHAQVKGRLRADAGIFPAGTPYDASDPKLLLWVHATLLESLPLAYEQFAGPLTSSEKDEYCTEASEASLLLGLPAQVAPSSMRELETYMQRMYLSGEIQVTDAARSLARTLLHPALGPLSPLFGVARLVTVGLLPPPIREAYGFAWGERQARALRRVASLARGTRGLVPARLRTWPAARAA